MICVIRGVEEKRGRGGEDGSKLGERETTQYLTVWQQTVVVSAANCQGGAKAQVGENVLLAWQRNAEASGVNVDVDVNELDIILCIVLM